MESGTADNIGIFDTETTGIDTGQDRIVSAFVGVLNTDGDVIRSKTWLLDPGVEIPAGATAVHGITTEHAQKHGRSPRECILEIVGTLEGILDDGLPICAYNAPFDLTLLSAEHVRAYGVDLDRNRFAPVLDPFVIDKRLDRYRKGKRDLMTTAAAHNVRIPDGDAHDAEFDAIVAGRLMQALRTHEHLADLDDAQIHARTIDHSRQQRESLAAYFRGIGKNDPVLIGWPFLTGEHAGQDATK